MKSKLFSLAIVALSFLASCTEENDISENPNEEFTSEELAEMAAVDKFAAANSVICALALIDELPDNWENTVFEPEEGVVLDEAEDDVRYVVSIGMDHARSYFQGIVPDRGLEGDTWTHEGVGTLTFREANSTTCYAVIDVNLVHMPGLKQIRLVPEEVVGENTYNGIGFYDAGDVVKDSKGHYWICVRPSGGPLHKSNAYFVSFDKSLIKTTTTTQNIYEWDDAGQLSRDKNKNLSGKWTFAKSLVKERIAYAAAHTFLLLSTNGTYENTPYGKAFAEKGVFLAQNDLFNANLLRSSVDANPNGKTEPICIAYESCISYNHKEVTQVKYIQPVLISGLNPQDGDSYVQIVRKAWGDESNVNMPSKYLLSLTVDYDQVAYKKFVKGRWDGKDYGYASPFNVLRYAANHTPGEYPVLGFESGWDFCHGIVRGIYAVPLIMVQTSIKDHGKPYRDFTLVSAAYNGPRPDYWGSVQGVKRTVFDKENYGETFEACE